MNQKEEREKEGYKKKGKLTGEGSSCLLLISDHRCTFIRPSLRTFQRADPNRIELVVATVTKFYPINIFDTRTPTKKKPLKRAPQCFYHSTRNRMNERAPTSRVSLFRIVDFRGVFIVFENVSFCM